MPNQPRTPMLSVRVPRDVQDAAKARAQEKGETMTAAVNRFLRNYGRKREAS